MPLIGSFYDGSDKSVLEQVLGSESDEIVCTCSGNKFSSYQKYLMVLI